MALRRRLAAASLLFLSPIAAQWATAQTTVSSLNLPDDPAVVSQQSTPSGASQSTPAAAGQTPPAQSTDGQLTDEEKRKKSKEQLEQQEHQRVLGVMATFNTTNNKDALPLTSKQKFQLFFKSATDPWPFMLTAVSAGIDQAENSFPEYGQGMEGYGKRYGADYADYFSGNFFGNAVLTSWWHEDPRYFQKGTGSGFSRFMWAAGSTVWCKRDNGTWGPNYANVIGNLMGAALSNVYYPASDRTVGETLERGFSVSAQGIVGAEVIEFWPDIARRYHRKHMEKLAKQQAQRDAQSGIQPAPPASTSPKPQN